MKTLLTPEDSQRLIDLGVDPKLASMVSWKQTEDWAMKSVLDNKEHLTLKPFRPAIMGFERFEVKDIFTLADLLSILPKEIEYNNMRISLQMYQHLAGYWITSYVKYSGNELIYQKPLSADKELIDALYSLLIQCLENKIIKLNELI